MKKTAESTARLRCRPAAQTPRSRATGVWKAQLMVVRSRLSQAAWRNSGSLKSRVQLAVRRRSGSSAVPVAEGEVHGDRQRDDREEGEEEDAGQRPGDRGAADVSGGAFRPPRTLGDEETWDIVT